MKDGKYPLMTLSGAYFRGGTRRVDVPYVFHDLKSGKPYKDIKRSFPSACKKAVDQW